MAVLVVWSALTALPATAATVSVAPTALDFGEVIVGTTSPGMAVVITNTGGAPITPNYSGGAPFDSANFGGSQNCAGMTLAPGASCQFTYLFHPTVAGPLSSSTTIGVDSDNFHITFSGVGCGNPCLPTITDFTPTSGPVGTSVVIEGTRLTGTTSVTFGGVAATAFTVHSSGVVSATVPTGAVTGRIVVTTPGGTATSTTDFTVTVADHFRSLSLTLAKHLVARGRVSSDLAACKDEVQVTVQRRKPGAGWRNVGHVTTNTEGKFRIALRDRVGRYRARVLELTLGSGDVCPAATSNRQQHLH